MRNDWTMLSGGEAEAVTALAVVATEGGLQRNGDGFAVDVQRRTITGAALMSIGPAMGHDFHIDAENLDEIVTAMSEKIARGEPVKSRFGHHFDWQPGDPIDASLEYTIGKVTRVYRDADTARVDLLMYRHDPASGPDRGLKVLMRAEEDPASLGLSVFANSSGEVAPDGRRRRKMSNVRFADVVDRGAAVRNGFLSAGPGSVEPPAPDPAPDTDPTNMKLSRRQIKFLVKVTGKTADQVKALKPEEVAAAVAKAKPTERAGYAVLGDADEAVEAAALTEAGFKVDEPWEREDPPAAEPEPEAAPAASTPEGGEAAATQAAATTPAGAVTTLSVGTNGSLTMEQHARRAVDADRQRRAGLAGIAAIAERDGIEDANLQLSALENDPELTVATASRRLVNAQMRDVVPLSQGSRTRVSVGEDNNVSSLGPAMRDALLLREGTGLYEYAEPDEITGERHILLSEGQPVARRAHPRAREFRGDSLAHMCRRFLVARGVAPIDADNMQAGDLTPMLLSRGTFDAYTRDHPGNATALAFGNHSSSDFISTMNEALEYQLRVGYDLEESVHEELTSDYLCSNLKDQKFVTLSDATLPEKVNEGGEYAFGTFREIESSARLAKYGQAFAFTDEALINDELNILQRGMRFGQNARIFEEMLFFWLLLGNPTIEETGAQLFSAGHGNLNSGGARDFDKESVGASRKAMRFQRGVGARPGEKGHLRQIAANTLLGPVELEDEMEVLTGARDLGGPTNTPKPSYLSRLRYVTSPFLDEGVTLGGITRAGSLSRFYTIARGVRGNPPVHKMKAGFQPNLATIPLREGKTIDQVAFKCRFFTGFHIPDYRVWQVQEGA